MQDEPVNAECATNRDTGPFCWFLPLFKMDKIEEFLESLEDTLYSSLNAATPDIARVQERLGQAWTNLTRYGPVGMPQLMDHLPSLGDFEVPPPPPPPPPPATWYESSVGWIEKHPWQAGGVVVGVAGAGLLVGYGGIYTRTLKARSAKDASGRRHVVVVLGADTSLGIPLVNDLERKGYIVIASVATPQAADDLERRSRGYVRALVLDPSQPAGIPVFLRSMATTLTRRFPLNSPGDPFALPLNVHSVVSLLSLAAPAVHAPFENINLQSDYIPYLNATQITPLQVIQSILPLFRNLSSIDNNKNIVICIPATAARVGLPFSAMQSMAAAGTVRAAEVLRREISVAALTGKSEAMKHINVVVTDIGVFDVAPSSPHLAPEDVYKSMERWSVSEKLTYGAGFAAISHPPQSKWESLKGQLGDHAHYGVPRKPTDVKVFLDSIACVVSNGRLGPTFFGFNIGLGWIRNLIRGERFSIGAGSHTYKYASFLPSLILDALLNIPHFLVGLRNAMLPVESPSAPADLPPVEPPVAPIATEQHDDTSSEAGSEADAESNPGESSHSWVRLRKSETDNN